MAQKSDEPPQSQGERRAEVQEDIMPDAEKCPMCSKYSFIAVSTSENLGVIYVTYRCTRCGHIEVYRAG